jgi:protein-S-isoprenylcysteine O-methyltransferase Ste14
MRRGVPWNALTHLPAITCLQLARLRKKLPPSAGGRSLFTTAKGNRMRCDQIVIIVLFVLMAVQMVGFSLFLRKHELSIGGVPPIGNVAFKTAKIAMMSTWIALLLQGTGKVDLSLFQGPAQLILGAVCLLTVGVFLQLTAYFFLGRNLKFGIPDQYDAESVTLKKKGLYRFSRNPMYVGFFCMMAAASVYIMNPVVWVLAVYATMVHHRIVLKEEQFLFGRFGNKWREYTKKVRRYL